MSDSIRESFTILRAQAGDRTALEVLLRGIQLPLRKYLNTILQDDNLADDVLQDVLLIIARKIRTLHNVQLFRPWMFRIASRQAFKILKKERKWRREAQDLQQIPSSSSELEPLDDFDQEFLQRRIDRLSPSIRLVIVLHYFESQTLQAIATILSIPLGTVKSRLSYGLSILRRDCTE